MPESAGARYRWLAAGCIAVYGACCLLLWAARDWRPEWDGAVYLLVAESLAAGEGYLYQGEPFFLRPPGLPWMLSFLAGGEGFDPYRVNLLLMFFAAAAVGAIYLAARRVTGEAGALLVALLSGTSLLFSQLFNSVFAEFPFVAFSFLAIAALERSIRGGGRWWAWAAAGGVCLAVAISMRTVGVLLLPGVLLVPAVRCRGRGRWRGVLPVLLALVLTSPWWRYSGAAAAAAEVPVEQDLLYDYSTALFHVDPGDPASAWVDLDGWVTRVTSNGAALLRDVSEATLYMPAGPVLQGALVVLLIVGLALAVRRRGVSLIEWLGLVYVPLIATYFVYDKRLVMPLVPLVYLYIGSAVFGLAARVGSESRARAVALGVSAALLALNVVFLVRDLSTRTHVGGVNAEIARAVVEHTPPDARIMCNQAPTMALLTGRRTFTYRFVRSADILSKYDIDFVLYDTPGTPPALVRMVEAREVERWQIPFGQGRRTQLIRIQSSSFSLPE